MTHIRCRFITIDGRRVHLRLGGAGPPVVLLHQSPQSSAAMLPIAEALTENHAIIAPDTPGCGYSDPLPLADPAIGDIAAALDLLLDRLEVPRAAFVGVHTGALIALEYAHRAPQRVTRVIADGLPVFTAAERHRLLAEYLPPFVPRRDGTHLAWLWSRLRAQATFFPWYDTRPEARLDMDMPDAAALHAWCMDFLRAGDHYRDAYGAAFRYSEAAEVAATLPVPLVCLYREGDPLAAHAQRLPVLAPPGRIERLPRGYGPMRARICEVLREPGAAAPAWQPRATPPKLDTELLPQYVEIPGQGQLALHAGGAARARPVLLLHDAARSARQMLPLAQRLAARRAVIVPDLPGHGASATLDGERLDPATALAAVLDALGLERADVVARGLGARAALELARRGRAARLTLIGAAEFDDTERRELAAHPPADPLPCHCGAHLLRAWQALHDARLFWPWYRQVRAAIRRDPPRLDPSDLQLELLDALECSAQLDGIWRRAFEPLPPVSTPTQVLVFHDHPLRTRGLALAARLPQVQIATLEADDDAAIAAAVEAFSDA